HPNNQTDSLASVTGPLLFSPETFWRTSTLANGVQESDADSQNQQGYNHKPERCQEACLLFFAQIAGRVVQNHFPRRGCVRLNSRLRRVLDARRRGGQRVSYVD